MTLDFLIFILVYLIPAHVHSFIPFRQPVFLGGKKILVVNIVFHFNLLKFPVNKIVPSLLK